MKPKAKTSYSCKLTAEQGDQLRRLLDSKGYSFREIPHALFAAQQEKLNVVFYRTGKLLVQGKETESFVKFLLEPEILGEARMGYEHVLDPTLLDPRIGIDESGKGDYFGPLCVAGVYVNASIIPLFEDAGLMDSKKISSDRRIAQLAEMIRKTPGCLYTVIPIGPEAYNRLHLKMRTVNALLAWGHARAIENLMERKNFMNPPPVRAISDQFARSKSTVARALMSEGREIKLVQRHKAEEDIAVAAASILARDAFVSGLEDLGEQIGFELPKGAGPRVIEVAKKIVQNVGKQKLATYSKLHFKTTQAVQ
jgi:ribonuclease HIII